MMDFGHGYDILFRVLRDFREHPGKAADSAMPGFIKELEDEAKSQFLDDLWENTSRRERRGT